VADARYAFPRKPLAADADAILNGAAAGLHKNVPSTRNAKLKAVGLAILTFMGATTNTTPEGPYVSRPNLAKSVREGPRRADRVVPPSGASAIAAAGGSDVSR
jgi:hypothetical protein